MTAQQKKRPGVEQQRQAILEAAVELFSQAGTAAVSVSAISKQAGVSRDTFYRCYDNKDEVVDALYEKSVSGNMLAIVASDEADFADPEWLAGAIDTMVDEILAEHQVARFLFVESADPSSAAHQVVESAFDEVALAMQRWCRERYGDAPGKDCFKGLLGAAQWLVHRAIVNELQPAEIRSTKQAIQDLFGAVFRGLQT